MSRTKLQRQQGIALVSVLAVTVVTVILAAIFSYMVISERRSTGAATASSSSLQLADAASERARAIIVDKYEESFLSSNKFVEKLADPADPLAIELGNRGAVAAEIGGTVAQWRYDVPDVAPTSENTPGGSTKTDAKWLDIYASAETGQGVQTVIRRITMGQSDIFTLAMLSENTDCMYCHLQVFGDVGSLGYFAPGHEGVGSAGDGGGSTIRGDLFVVPDPTEQGNNIISNNETDLTGERKKVNGAIFEGEVFENYEGSRFPLNSEKKPEFPPITRKLARASADGAITGGAIAQLVGADDDLNAAPSRAETIGSVNDGNVVLIGTKEKPINLSGDVYFSGDVVIKGYVSGKGGIYAGRNVYVAGDIKNVKEPTRDCRLEQDPDQCAQDIIDGGADELRIAARGNIILGDYTETEGTLSGDAAEAKRGRGTPKKSFQGLNAADYFREQFGFNNDSGTDFYYDETNGDELERQADGSFKNADGELVEVGNVSDPPVGAEAAYDNSMRPGKVDGNGFDSWLSDETYQSILGKQKRAFDTWRKSITRAELKKIYDDAGGEVEGIEAIKELLGEGAENVSAESIKELACADGNPCDENASFDLTNEAGEAIGQVSWGRDGKGPVIKVILDESALYDTQVNRVDAFLYSNQRIAGKTFNAPLAINGGLVSKQLGVLAPGVEKQAWQNSRYDFLSNDSNDCNSFGSVVAQLRDSGITEEPKSIEDFAKGYYDLGLTTVNGTATKGYNEDCAFTVNYDYRMRNGGLGFNLVAQDVGRTVSWRVGSTRDDRVQVP